MFTVPPVYTVRPPAAPSEKSEVAWRRLPVKTWIAPSARTVVAPR